MNQKLTLNPLSDSSDDVAVPSDDAVRQALLRMGSGRPRGNTGAKPVERQTERLNERHNDRAHDRPHGYASGNNRRGAEAAQNASPDARRRRFSQNENVPVEYVSRDRSARGGERLDLGRVEVVEPAEDRTGFLERELERERQVRAAAEASLNEKTRQIDALRTRVAHLEIDLQEARSQRQAMIDMAQNAAQQSAAQQSAAQHQAEQQRAADARAAAALAALGGSEEDDDAFEPSPVRRGRGRPRRVPVEVDAVAEPEPVKWWTD